MTPQTLQTAQTPQTALPSVVYSLTAETPRQKPSCVTGNDGDETVKKGTKRKKSSNDANAAIALDQALKNCKVQLQSWPEEAQNKSGDDFIEKKKYRCGGGACSDGSAFTAVKHDASDITSGDTVVLPDPLPPGEDFKKHWWNMMRSAELRSGTKKVTEDEAVDYLKKNGGFGHGVVKNTIAWMLLDRSPAIDKDEDARIMKKDEWYYHVWHESERR